MASLARSHVSGAAEKWPSTSTPTSAEVFNRPAPLDPAKTLTREIISIGIDMIRATTDDLAAVALERILEHLVDVADRLAIVELELSEALTIAYERHVVITRQQEQIGHLRDLARGAR